MRTSSRLQQCGLPEPRLWHKSSTSCGNKASFQYSSSAATTAFSLSRNHVFRGFTLVNPFRRFLTFETGFLGSLESLELFSSSTLRILTGDFFRNLLQVFFGFFHWQVCVSHTKTLLRRRPSLSRCCALLPQCLVISATTETCFAKYIRV